MKKIMLAGAVLLAAASPAMAEGAKAGRWSAPGGSCDTPAIVFEAPDANGDARGEAIIDGKTQAIKTGDIYAPSFLVNPDTDQEYMISAEWEGASIKLKMVLGAPTSSATVGGALMDSKKKTPVLTACPQTAPAPVPSTPPADPNRAPLTVADLLGSWGATDKQGNATYFGCRGDKQLRGPGETMTVEGEEIPVYGSHAIVKGASGQLYQGNGFYLRPISIVATPVARGIAFLEGETVVVLQAVDFHKFRHDQHGQKVFPPSGAYEPGAKMPMEFFLYSRSEVPAAEPDKEPFVTYEMKCVVR